MQRQTIFRFAAVFAIAGLALAACQPQTIIQTVEVRQTVPVVQTQVVNQTQVVEVTAQPGSWTRPHPVLSDVSVRRALAHCTNKLELLASVYPLLNEEERLGLFMDTNIPKAHWAYAGDENITIYPFDIEKGQALLDEAGWTLPEGEPFRKNANGEELALKLTTTTAAFRQTWAAVWEQQMAACGVHIVRFHAPASWFFGDTTGLSRRDYELGAFAWVGQADPAGQTIWACDQIALPENNWTGQNTIGWCNETASNAIKAANNTLIKEERVEQYKIFQQEFANDMVNLPLFNRTNTYAIAAGFAGFEPRPGQPFVNYNAQEWEIPGTDTIVYGFTQEPASLFTLVESAQVAVVASGFIQGYAYTSLNYDFQSGIQTELGTIENNLAANDPVEVKAGDTVWDANGNLTELAPGVTVRDVDGNLVEFTGDPVTMKQLTVEIKFRDDLVWSDGVPVSQADYELKFKIDCDRESGATSFITCDQIQGLEFASNGYTAKLVPGVQSPLYFLAFDGNTFPDIYPAHRVIESDGPYKGKTLAEVPAKDWATLREIAENPIGVGPYVIKEWVKGERMVFEANPYYFGGAPKTPNLVISFIAPENAEAQLIGGQVDILDDSTLVGVTEVLKNAADSGAIRAIIIPSATWEHIDMQLFLP
jgi:ABC-type transport system substrate-binding protein